MYENLYYWVCQECYQGHTSVSEPKECPVCGTQNGKWKKSHIFNMGSFKLYECYNCGFVGESPDKRSFVCPQCGRSNWRIFDPD